MALQSISGGFQRGLRGLTSLRVNCMRVSTGLQMRYKSFQSVSSSKGILEGLPGFRVNFIGVSRGRIDVSIHFKAFQSVSDGFREV